MKYIDRHNCELVLLVVAIGSGTQTKFCVDLGTVYAEFSAENNGQTGKPQSQLKVWAILRFTSRIKQTFVYRERNFNSKVWLIQEA